jgi:hypothetical protein
MIVQQERVANKIVGGEAKKRWTAPEVTRLDFPKTAFAKETGFPDSSYSHGS